MGGGSYDYLSSKTRGIHMSSVYNCISEDSLASMSEELKSEYATRVARDVAQHEFKARSLDPDMDINGKVRESCDSEEHPTSFPIIIALDLTGSMSTIPAELVTNAFPEVMKSIMEANVEHAQVCFVGVGDDVYDRAPIQVGQFETSDELTEKWLKKLYLEGGGGGNYGESYALAWYVAANCTKIDSYEKRGKKGCLITIGDEPVLKEYSKNSLKSLFGDQIQSDMTAISMYKDASKKWDIYHINAVSEYRKGVTEFWKENIPGIQILEAERTTNSIAAQIISAVITSYNKSASAMPETPSETKSKNEKGDIIL